MNNRTKYYYHHPESSCLWWSYNPPDIELANDDGLTNELCEEDALKWMKEYEMDEIPHGA